MSDIKVILVCLTGESFDVEVGQSATVHDLQEKIRTSQDLECEVKLIKESEVLSDDAKTLMDVGVENGTTLSLLRCNPGPILLRVDKINDSQANDQLHTAVESPPLKHPIEKVEITAEEFADQGWGYAKSNLCVALYPPVSKHNHVFSGASVFLTSESSGKSRSIVVQDGEGVHAKWHNTGSWEQLIIEKVEAESNDLQVDEIHVGDAIYLKSHLSTYIDVEDGIVQALSSDNGERGSFQKLIIETDANQPGPVQNGDSVYFKSHTGKYISVSNGKVVAHSDRRSAEGKLTITTHHACLARSNIYGTYRSEGYKHGKTPPSKTYGPDDEVVSKATPGCTYRLEYTVGGGGGHCIRVKNWECKIFPINSGQEISELVEVNSPLVKREDSSYYDDSESDDSGCSYDSDDSEY